MNNFEYSNPTRLVFGKGEESRIGELMRARVPAMSPDWWFTAAVLPKRAAFWSASPSR